MDYRQRYNEAHLQWFKTEYPQAYADGFYCPPKMPAVAKANGLTQFILNWLKWSGYYGNRVSSAGRYLAGLYIKSTTRKGSADVVAIIKGVSIHFEIKVGKDKPSPDQLKEQAKVRGAGGHYEFVHTPEEFFTIIKRIIL
jgi:hypothetical protein